MSAPGLRYNVRIAVPAPTRENSWALQGVSSKESTPPELACDFFLDDKDRAEVAGHRGSHNRLGYATQLCTVRFLSTFLPNPTDVHRIVVKHLAAQLVLGWRCWSC